MPEKRYKPPALAPAALRLQAIKRQMVADSLKRKLTVRDLRAKYDLSAASVRALLVDKGGESVRRAAAGFRDPRPRYNVIDRSPPERFFADARTQRFTRSELAAKYGVSYEKAANYLRDANIEVPRKLSMPGGGVKSAMGRRLLHMLALRKQGKTMEEVGTFYRITRERVRQILDHEEELRKRYGLEPARTKTR